MKINKNKIGLVIAVFSLAFFITSLTYARVYNPTATNNTTVTADNFVAESTTLASDFVGGITINSWDVATTTTVCVSPAHCEYVANGTNDEVTINNAITFVNGAGGGVVRMKEGTYNISNNVVLKNNVKLLGESWGTILKITTNSTFSNAGIVRVDDVDNVIVENFTVDGNKSNQSSGSNKMGVYLECDYCAVKSLYVHDTPSYGIDPHEQNGVASTTYLSITDNWVKDAGDSVLGDFDGITLDKVQYALVSNNLVEGSSRHGISLVTGSRNVTVTGNVVRGSGDNGINLNGSTEKIEQVSVVGNITYGNTLNGIYVATADNNTVTGNSVELNQQRGIRLYKASYNVVSGNSLLNNSQSSNNSYDAIQIDDDGSTFSTYNSITSNTIREVATNKARYGIREDATGNNYNVISGNVVTGTVTGDISVQGANTTVYGNITDDSTDSIFLNGNFGIGETAPASTLEMTSTGTTDLQIMSSGAGTGGRLILEDTDGAGCTQITVLNGTLTGATVTCP